MPVLVGLDCGGSSTRLLAVDGEGTVVATAQAGGANLMSTPEPKLLRHLATASQFCPPAEAVCGCFAGLVGEEERARAIHYLQSLFPQAICRAEPDFAAAYAACEAGTHVCVIAGTGSLVCSQHEGSMRKSGGRGYLLGDEGSAYQLGRDALLAYLRSPTEASDAMKVVVEKYMGSLEEARILHRIYQSTTPQALIAKLAKGIGADAKLGLPYASASIRQRMGELASIVESHVQQNLSHQPHLEIGLAGGLWQIAPVFREQLMNQLLQRLPNHSLHLSRIQRAPVMGAVVLAREAILGN